MCWFVLVCTNTYNSMFKYVYCSFGINKYVAVCTCMYWYVPVCTIVIFLYLLVLSRTIPSGTDLYHLVPSGTYWGDLVLACTILYQT
jgi:hypothetical protein